MSIIQNIREKYAAVSIAVIAISLVGFILMDALSSRTGVLGGQDDAIGIVNGKKINRVEFDTKIAATENNYRSRGMDVRDETRQQITESIWNLEIEQAIQKEEYEKLGLVFTSNDLDEALFGENPPSDFREAFKDPKTGAYDANQARQQIKKIQKSTKDKDLQAKAELENYIKEGVIVPGLRSKYQNLLRGSVYYPKWLFEKEQNDQNSIASINYVLAPFSSIPDSAINVSDQEITEYVNKHKNQYKQEASKTLSYVIFDGVASSADSGKIREELTQKSSEFTSAANVESYLNINSSAIPYFNGFVLESKLSNPAADSIKKLSIGNVFGPYLDGSNYVLAKMIERRTMPDSITCRHILIATKNQQTGATLPDSIAQKRADSIASVVASGGNFTILAAQLSDDPGSKDKGGEYKFSAQDFGSLAKPFAEFVFYQPAGSKSVVKTDFGYHYIEVVNQKDFQPAVKVAYLAKTIEPSDETVASASTASMQFASSSRDKAGFEKTSRDKKLTPRTADVKQNDYTIVGVGSARSLIRWAFENNTGAVSEPETIGEKIIVALISESKEKGTMSAKDARPSVGQILLSRKKAQKLIEKTGDAKDISSIAAKHNTQIIKADSLSFGSPFIINLGSEPRVVGASFNPSNKEKASSPISGNSGVYYIQTLMVGLKPSSGVDYTNTRQQTEQNLKSSLVYKSLESVKKSADITDNRIKFY
jgi:peptidyl-prolyl cis-trans isomerase D